MDDGRGKQNHTILGIHKELEALLKQKEEMQRHPPLGPLSPSAKRNKLATLSKAVDDVIRRLLRENEKAFGISTSADGLQKRNPDT
jgi:hypothetical protein